VDALGFLIAGLFQASRYRPNDPGRRTPVNSARCRHPFCNCPLRRRFAAEDVNRAVVDFDPVDRLS
jgi:hypothetical protein